VGAKFIFFGFFHIFWSSNDKKWLVFEFKRLDLNLSKNMDQSDLATSLRAADASGSRYQPCQPQCGWYRSTQTIDTRFRAREPSALLPQTVPTAARLLLRSVEAAVGTSLMEHKNNLPLFLMVQRERPLLKPGLVTYFRMFSSLSYKKKEKHP
jgi:hypothetical protein